MFTLARALALASATQVRVLEDWRPPFAGFVL
jgi:hypothetical protein